MVRILLLSTTVLLAVSSASAATPVPAPAPTITAEADQNTVIQQFFVDFDDAELARAPMSKAYRAIKDADYGRWNDFSDAAEIRQHDAELAALAEMRRRFDPDKLDANNRLSFQLFEKMIERRDRAFAYRDHEYAFDQMNGAQSQLPAFLINIHRVTTKADAEAYVRRLEGLGAAIDQIIAESAIRAAKGLMPPKWVYPYVISDAKNVIAGAPFGDSADAPLFADLKAKVARLDIPQGEKDALIAAGAAALTSGVKPAFNRLIAEMVRQEALAGVDDGVWRFKYGASYYAERLANYTTAGLTPEQIHKVGLDNVARIHGGDEGDHGADRV